MTVVQFSDYRREDVRDKISLADLQSCIKNLKKEAKAAGFEEVADLLAICGIAAADAAQQ